MKANWMLKVVRILYKIVEFIAPQLAEKWVIHIFFSPRRFDRTRTENNLLVEADVQKIDFHSEFGLDMADKHYCLYSWGQGPVVLLVHGWEGRGSQMAHFTKPLVEQGYRVIAFDAPAHGRSSGKKTNVPEVGQVVKDIEKRVGGFHAIVAHSFGGVVSAYALSNGVSAQKVVTIGAPTVIDLVFAKFAEQLNISPQIIAKLTAFLERFTARRLDDFSMVNVMPTLAQHGLIIHDKNDREIPFDQAVRLSEKWESSQLMLTSGLGHRRILKDQTVISKSLEFILST